MCSDRSSASVSLPPRSPTTCKPTLADSSVVCATAEEPTRRRISKLNNNSVSSKIFASSPPPPAASRSQLATLLPLCLFFFPCLHTARYHNFRVYVRGLARKTPRQDDENEICCVGANIQFLLVRRATGQLSSSRSLLSSEMDMEGKRERGRRAEFYCTCGNKIMTSIIKLRAPKIK